MVSSGPGIRETRVSKLRVMRRGYVASYDVHMYPCEHLEL